MKTSSHFFSIDQLAIPMSRDERICKSHLEGCGIVGKIPESIQMR